MGIESASGITAVVLAGGKSTRFGSDKASSPLAGWPMLDWVVRACAEVCAPVVVVHARGQTLPGVSVDVEMAEDFVDGAGPLAGLAAGLRAANTEFAFVTSCDAPLVQPALIRLLVASLDGHDAACPKVDGRLQPLVALYRVPTTLEAAEEALVAGESSLHALLAHLRIAVVNEAAIRAVDPDLGSFVNINRPHLRADAEARLLSAGRSSRERPTADG